MNWSSAKSIFIIVFLLLNSFLGYQILEKQLTPQMELAQLYEQSIEELLYLHHISIEVDLSVNQSQMSQLKTRFINVERESDENVILEGQQLTREENILTVELAEPIDIGDEFELDSFIDVMGEHVLHAGEYEFDRLDNERIIFRQVYESHPIFLGTLAFERNEQNQIEYYEQVLFEVLNEENDTEEYQDILSAYTALRTLLDNQAIPSQSKIVDVTLGYYGQIYDVDSQVLTPVWRVVIEHEQKKQVLYVNAFTGTIEYAPKDES